MEPLSVLVLGSGGREHALCWKIAQSPLCETLYCAPGNPGIAEVAECVFLSAADHDRIIAFCEEKAIGLVVIGPEAPLVAGIVDDLSAAGIACFGPDGKAAQIEGSKTFSKELCIDFDIPTAAYESFTKADPAIAYINKIGAPLVVKADGLAAGKGVTIAQTEGEAVAAVKEAFSGRFGDAGRRVVIEEFLEGEEASFFALVDGEDVLALGYAQDHKAVGEGDTGPNTGGMGTYSPPPLITDALHAEIMKRIVHPSAKGMSAQGTPYSGVMFIGLMLTKDGPKVLEYNARFGDPETQVLMPRIEGDLLPLLHATATGTLNKAKPVTLSPHAALCVVMATQGYPGDYKKGSEIKGLGAAAAEDVLIFHAGTSHDGGRILASGGRVLGVTGLGNTVADAQAQAYKAVDTIDWPEGFCRRDIGWRALGKKAA